MYGIDEEAAFRGSEAMKASRRFKGGTEVILMEMTLRANRFR